MEPCVTPRPEARQMALEPRTPSSIFKVRGKHQELGCELDRANLQLGEPLAPENGSHAQVFAGVYHEPETGISHEVAAKRFEIASSRHQVQSIHREIGVLWLASTRCHHCARCWGFTQDADGALILVMKRYQQSLSQRLAADGGGLSLPDVQRFGLQIARAGIELHAQSVLLADLKPPNILLDEFEEIAVADFGVSMLLLRGAPQDGGMHGTFNYMSPEAFDPESIGRLSTKTDIWSFACCIVEMASGERPWKDTQMSAICYKITFAREIPHIPEHLPADLRALLKRCFAYDSAERPSFHEIYQVFAQWGRELQQRETQHSLVHASECVLRPRAERTSHEDHADRELARLRREEERWHEQRKDLVDKMRRDACLIADMQKNAVEHQQVNERLQEQLALLVESLKQSQSAPGKKGGDPSGSAANVELELAGCQSALKQCMRQKDVAKEMLRQESARTGLLNNELRVLKADKEQVQDLALQLAVQAQLAQSDVSRIVALNAVEHHTPALHSRSGGMDSSLSKERASADVYCTQEPDTHSSSALSTASTPTPLPMSLSAEDWDVDRRLQ